MSQQWALLLEGRMLLPEENEICQRSHNGHQQEEELNLQ